MEWQILFVDRVFDLLTDRMVDSFVIRIIDLLTDVVFEFRWDSTSTNLMRSFCVSSVFTVM